MSAIGSGVTKDSAATPLRLAFFDSSHADFQLDQTGFNSMDCHKLWACMGRAGSNGIMRDGFIDEGDDPLNGWAPGGIEEVVGGVPVGADRWNTLNGYNPLGGLNTNDFCIFSTLAPCDNILLHLDAGLGTQPAFVLEGWAGAWTALTLTVTPDFTCAGGIFNQRVAWTRIQTLVTATPAQLGLALANPGTYYRYRLRLTAPIGAGPLANQRYKDFMAGHIKHFYCHYGLKRGDDSINGGECSWNHPGDVILRFRDGFSLEGKTGMSGEHSWGKEQTTPTGNRPTLSSGGTVICSSGKGPVVFGGAFFGVMLMGCPKSNTHNMGFALRGGVVPLDLIGTLMMGFGAPTGAVVGSAGPTVARRIIDSRFCIHPIFDSGVGVGIIGTYAVSSAADAVVDRFIVDVRPFNYQYAVRSSVPGATISGVRITNDVGIVGGASSGQIVLTGGGTYNMYNIEWGGPSNKVFVSGTAIEWRRHLTYVHEDSMSFGLAGIPVRYKLADNSVFLDGIVTESDGHSPLVGGGIFTFNKDRFPASTWGPAGNSTEILNDEPMTVIINPVDDPNHNPHYQTETIVGRFGKELMFNDSLSDYEIKDWQRVDYVAVIALRRADGITAPIIPIEADGVQRIDVILPEAT